VALLATVPLLLLPARLELVLVEFLLAAFIFIVGFAVARGVARAAPGRWFTH
jgi:hypothetical protein